jgi:hypothetical protein
VPEFAGANERTLRNEVGEIAGRRSRRCPGNRDVVPCAETSFKTFGAFSEHTQESLLLPGVDIATQAIEQLRFQDNELHLRNASLLSFERDSGEPREPFGYIDLPIGPL